METRLKRKASLVTSRPYLIVTLAEDWRAGIQTAYSFTLEGADSRVGALKRSCYHTDAKSLTDPFSLYFKLR